MHTSTTKIHRQGSKFFVKTIQDKKAIVFQCRTLNSKSYNLFPCEMGSFSRTYIPTFSHLKN